MVFSIRVLFSQSVASLPSKIVTRQFRKTRNVPRVRDPGIGARKELLSLLNNHGEEITDFEDLESDFMEVHKSHKEHTREMELLKEQEKYHIVKQKYFKEKFPNFLTWHDKEQIRYLHRTDPEEWTIERLSEGFPALPEIIQKIVKSNWTKTTQNKITNHDMSVQKNWKLFKGGGMADLPDHLAEHLNKFTNRALNFKPFVIPNAKPTFKVKSNIGTEFGEVITSYEKILKKNCPDDGETPKVTAPDPKPPLQETYMKSHSNNRQKMLTLNELQHNLKKKLESGKGDEEDKIIVANFKPRPLDNRVEHPNQVVDLTQNKYQTPQVFKKTEKDLSHLTYPEKISIPKSIFKKGFIYKLNDCYYDDDGEFLYRVPGMG